MIVLDTNVVSEAMKPAPHPAVRAWLNAQAAETLYLSQLLRFELRRRSVGNCEAIPTATGKA